jgi:hypothetical protein
MADMEPTAGTENQRRFGRPSRANTGRERMTERGGTQRATETERDGAGPLSAREALALVETQRERTARSLHVDVPLIFILWGIAWLGGFGVTYFAYGPAGGSGVPEWLAITVTVVLNAAAAATSAGQAVRRGHGVEGPSRQVMVMYMWAWPLAFGGLLAVNAGLFAQGAPLRLAPLLWPASATVVAGILYLATGFLFRDPSAYRLGTWMLIVGPASVFAGAPGNFAVLALAGGGGFLAAAAPYIWRRRRSPA